MKKSTLLMVLSLVLALALGVGGTMAYLQDTDADVNVMTLGNVYITQNEQEYNAAGELVEFTQDKPLYPYVGQLGWKNKEVADGAYRQFTMNNVVDKYVTVTNTGKSDAYVRTFIALEMGDYTVEEFEMIGVSINAENGGEFKFPGTWVWGEDFVVEIDGNNYYVMVAEHQDALAPGETTIPSLNQIYLKNTAGNEEVEKLDGNGNGKYDVLVLSQAVQTQGFADANESGSAADEALNEAFPYGTEKAATVAGWFGEAEVGTPGDKLDTNNPPKFISNVEELKTAVENGGTYILTEDINTTETLNVTEELYLNLNGHTLTASVFEAKADTTMVDGTFVHGKSTYPALSVSAGTLKMKNMEIVCEEYCSITYDAKTGTKAAAEYVAFQVWGGEAILDNCSVTVKSDVKRYSNTIIAIGIYKGTFTMNNGSITVNNAGSTAQQYNYETVLFANGEDEKNVNLVDVQINGGEKTNRLYAWGGNTIVNTTDEQNSWNGLYSLAKGGTCTINYID